MGCVQKTVLWRHQNRPELIAEGVSRMTMEIESSGNAVKLTVIHENDVADSRMIKAVGGGWPVILSNLKSLLETGESIPETKDWSFAGSKRLAQSA
jgi:hypothetical protein